MLRFAALLLCAVLITGCIKIHVHSTIVDEDTIKSDVSMITNVLVAENIKESLRDEPIHIGTRHLDDGQVELYFTMENFPFDQADWDCSGLFTADCKLTVRQVFELPASMTILQTMADQKGGMSDEFEPTLTFTLDLPKTARNRSSNADVNNWNTTYQWHLNLRKNNMLNAWVKAELP
ncbi:hypothetical protein RYZ26_18355 [Terasakiella sp. A23]|uniref:hypothetical protein n=1 Tax=Terasakiella sp. FCG-A23 TaxID=3080561 RepID=UPI00295319AB|nr:hypothetical protein [Terasakiella sp. A23]MDV7341573.1 hypothetical protein [Terasakiella sp. A23]